MFLSFYVIPYGAEIKTFSVFLPPYACDGQTNEWIWDNPFGHDIKMWGFRIWNGTSYQMIADVPSSLWYRNNNQLIEPIYHTNFDRYAEPNSLGGIVIEKDFGPHWWTIASTGGLMIRGACYKMPLQYLGKTTREIIRESGKPTRVINIFTETILPAGLQSHLNLQVWYYTGD